MPYKDIEKRRRTQRERYWRDPVNRARQMASNRQRYYNDPEIAYLQHIKKTYGLLAHEYRALRDRQQNRCALCGDPPNQKHRQKRLHIDHDHASGRIRGLLCFHCNWRIGWFEDRRQKIEEYLTSSSKCATLTLPSNQGD